MPHFETDSNGDIVTNPVTGWMTLPVAGIAVLLAIQYIETPLDIDAANGKSVQLVLTPQQCLDLAEKLTDLAVGLFEGNSRSIESAN
jgi:hypothetical protein